MTPFTRTIQIGATTYPLTSDDDYLAQMADPFEPDLVALVTLLVQPTHIVGDVGANIGCTTLLFTQRAAHVHAFEPSPSTFALLSINIAQAGCTQVTLHQGALGREATQVPLLYAPSSRAGAFLAPTLTASPGHVTEPVAVQRLDALRAARIVPQLDVLKLDVEGSELAVLDGAQATLAACHPLVILEMNHWCLNAFHRITVPDFLDQLCATFPVLLALQGQTYLDVHNPGERYVVMYRHILQFHYMTLVGAFDTTQMQPVLDTYRHGAD